MPTLTPSLPIVEDETHLSWLGRLAAFHTRDSPKALISDLALDAARLVRGDPDEVKRLCALTGEDEARVLAKTIVQDGTYASIGSVDLGQLAFPTTMVRFCPHCLLDDDVQASGIAFRRIRLDWKFRFVRVCPVHDIRLIERARSRAYYARALEPWFPDPTEDLQDLASTADRLTASPFQIYLGKRVRGQLPGVPWLDQQTIPQAVLATELLGSLIRFGPQAKFRDLAEDDLDEAGRAGWEWTSQGPDAVWALLEGMFGLQSRRSPNPQQVFGFLRLVLSRDLKRGRPGPIVDLFDKFVAHHFPAQGRPGGKPGPPELGQERGTSEGAASGKGRRPSLSLDDHVAGCLPWQRGTRTGDAPGLPRDVILQRSLPLLLNASEDQVAALLGPIFRRPSDPGPDGGPTVARADLLRFLIMLGRMTLRKSMPKDVLPIAEAAKVAEESEATVIAVLFRSDMHRCAFRNETVPGVQGVHLPPDLVIEGLRSTSLRSYSMEEIGVRLGISRDDVQRLTEPVAGKVFLPVSKSTGGIRRPDLELFERRFASLKGVDDMFEGNGGGLPARGLAARLGPLPQFAAEGLTFFRREDLDQPRSGR